MNNETNAATDQLQAKLDALLSSTAGGAAPARPVPAQLEPTDDGYLAAQLRSMLAGDALPPAPPKPSAEKQPAAADELIESEELACALPPTVEQQIAQLRRRLRHALAVFETTRDELATLSFANMKKHYPKGVGETLRPPATSMPPPQSLADEQPTNDELMARALRHDRNLDIPQPFARFFGCVARLQEVVQSACATDGAWDELNVTADQRLRQEAEYVRELRSSIRATAEAAGLTAAEQRELERMADVEATLD